MTDGTMPYAGSTGSTVVSDNPIPVIEQGITSTTDALAKTGLNLTGLIVVAVVLLSVGAIFWAASRRTSET